MIGAGTAFSGFNLLLIAVGCLSGMLIGMLPGLGPISAIALLIPVSYALSPESGIMMLAGVYYGAIFGGSTSSILLNAPGVAGTVATAFDGYPMAREGQPGKALAIAAYASFIGGTVGVILLMVLAPQLAEFALAFQSPEYFMLMVLGLSLVFAFAEEGDHLKALAMVLLGLSLATVGTDRASGLPRFTFGSMELMDGISFLVLAMGTFAMTEAVYMAAKARIPDRAGALVWAALIGAWPSNDQHHGTGCRQRVYPRVFRWNVTRCWGNDGVLFGLWIREDLPETIRDGDGSRQCPRVGSSRGRQQCGLHGLLCPAFDLRYPRFWNNRHLTRCSHCLRDPTWTTALYRNAKSVLVCRDLHVYRQLNTSLSQSTADSLHCSHTHHSQITPRTTYSDVLGRRRLFSLL